MHKEDEPLGSNVISNLVAVLLNVQKSRILAIGRNLLTSSLCIVHLAFISVPPPAAHHLIFLFLFQILIASLPSSFSYNYYFPSLSVSSSPSSLSTFHLPLLISSSISLSLCLCVCVSLSFPLSGSLSRSLFSSYKYKSKWFSCLFNLMWHCFHSLYRQIEIIYLPYCTSSHLPVTLKP